MLAVSFCLGDGGPVQPFPEDVSLPGDNHSSPHQHPWYTDDVTWVTTSPLPQYQYRTANGVLGNYFYLFGEQNNPFANAYNITTDTWEPSTPPPLGNCNWCGVATDDAFYIVGRYDGAYHEEVQKFVPTGGGPTGTWSQVADYPLAMCGIAAAWDGGDLIYAAGGGGTMGSVAYAYKYSISADTWTQIASMPGPMKYHGGWFAAGKFMVYGGITLGCEHTLYIYDPATNTWITGASLLYDAYFATFNTTGTDMLMFSVGRGGYYDWGEVQIYDPTTNIWTMETTLPTGNGLNAAGYIGNGQVISAGGYPTTYTCYKGFGFPVGSDPQAPAVPSDFTVSHNNAALIASLDWINPSLTVSGDPLTDLDGVKIQRNGELIANVTDVTIGAPYSYDDATVPSAGMYYYIIIPHNDFGDGTAAFNNAWIGLDVPGCPSAVMAFPDPLQQLEATVTWEPPTAGGHGGYWPAGSWTGQRVYRDGEMIADLTGTNNQYVDDEVPVNNYYTYGVSYYNGSGEGIISEASEIFIGSPFYEFVPYNWVEIHSIGNNSGIIDDDQNVGPFELGLVFPWYDGVTHDSIRICSNGWLSFTSTSTRHTNWSIPFSMSPNDLIAPYWDDLYPPDGGRIWYYADVANERFIVEYEDIKHVAGNNGFYFETILYADGKIDFVYQTLGDPLNSATIGIENSSGTVGYQICLNGTGYLIPTDQTAIRIYPIGTIPDHDCDITLTPISPPIIIPANGGVFNFDVLLENNELISYPVDIWTMATLPDSTTYGPIMNIGITFNGGASFTRLRTQNVPAVAPSGNYTYDGYMGLYPNVIWAEDHFEFTKSATDIGCKIYPDWENWGESFDDKIEAVATVESFALGNAYPNPFNQSTVISYKLQVTSRMKLNVYDIMGREVAKLADGYQTAGNHEIIFDAKDLVSGVYFVRLEAGEFKQTQKILLIK